ncbi:MAG: hypothetical protein WC375_03975 [Methanomassiliicoccales archaeon]|jgi:hypothetical protein
MSSLDSAVDIIKGMKGTLKVFPLDVETREGVLKVERCIKSQMGMQVKNEGVEQCMQRRHVLCILKNTSFRPPPEPTVQLMADDGMIIGTEVIPGEKGKYSKDDPSLMWLCEDFVVFMDVKPEVKEYFYMPPVSFPELTAIPGVTEVVSCSPSPLGDLVVKNRYGIEDDPKNATIFVGFNASE